MLGLVALLTAAAALGARAQAPLTINTPVGATQCLPTSVNWAGGNGPYFLAVLPGMDTSATPLKQFPTTSATSFTWTVDIASGTSITLEIRDSTGTINYSSAITVLSSTDASCLNSGTTEASISGGAATGAAPAPAVSASGAGGSAAPASSAPAGSIPSANGVSTGAPSPSSPPHESVSPVSVSPESSGPHASEAAPTSSTGDGSRLQMGFAGLLGAALAVIAAAA